MILFLIVTVCVVGILSAFRYPKKGILIIAGLLVLFGIIAMYSVSTYESFQTTLRSTLFDDPTNYYFFNQHIQNIIIWIITWFVVYKFPLKFWTEKKTVMFIIIWAMILQLLVFAPVIWETFNWARWRISIPWIPNIQPSEFFKIAYVIFMSYWLLVSNKTRNEKSKIIWFVGRCIALLGVFVLIPDFWTAMILALVGILMLWYSGVWAKKVAWLLWIGIVVGIIGISFMSLLFPKRFGYIQKRLSYFTSAQTEETSQTVWWQNEQALMAIWWGWFRGQGYGKWLQKFGFIPEAQSDFIFSAYSEEVGFVGNITLLALYFFFVYFLLINLKDVKDPKLKLLAVGLASIIIIQMFVNIWVNIKILPNTWVTLPFISHGWSALIANVITLMILYKIINSNEVGVK